jgi:3-phenylpropionate/trans-cinnamate dioxygenase ferredoxin reductase subunit
MKRVVIVGAGLAGFTVARRLRELDYQGAISLFGNEAVAPYDRPPLSKDILKGEKTADDVRLQDRAFYEERDIQLHVSAQVTRIRPEDRTVEIGSEELGYDSLILATGATIRPLPDQMTRDLGGIYGLRDLSDAQALEHAFRAARRVLVIGGGYIGLEVAAAARSRGLEVTVLEAAPRILGRVAAAPTADIIRALHRHEGVDIHENTRIVAFTGDGHVTGATLSDGTRLATDCVVVGIGVSPNTGLAESAGLEIDDGIVVDDICQTSRPGIWAAGDCARFPSPHGPMRLESVGNAIAMGECVAENIMGAGRPFEVTPWFWSDQFDAKLQIVGLNQGHTRIVARDGAKDGAISYWYYRDDALISVDVINEPKTYMVAKRLIEAGKSPDPDDIADTSQNIKAFLKS